MISNPLWNIRKTLNPPRNNTNDKPCGLNLKISVWFLCISELLYLVLHLHSYYEWLNGYTFLGTEARKWLCGKDRKHKDNGLHKDCCQKGTDVFTFLSVLLLSIFNNSLDLDSPRNNACKLIGWQNSHWQFSFHYLFLFWVCVSCWPLICCPTPVFLLPDR